MTTSFGYVRVAAAVPHMQVADCQYNASEIKKQITEAVQEGVQVVCFPELSITGYTCADLFFTQQLQKDALSALDDVCTFTRDLPIIVLVGAPLKVDNNLYNCAFVMTDGEVIGIVPKINLPNTGEFYEKRWFSSGRDVLENNVNSIRPRIPTIELWGNDVPFGIDLLFTTKDYSFGIELCEDLWSPLPASTQLAIQGAEIIFNLSSSNCVTGKHAFRQRMITQQSARVHCGYVYTSSGIGESTTDIVFSGSTYIAENGEMLEIGERFQMESSMIISEIDVERLRIDRQRNTNFTHDKHGQFRHVQVAPLEPSLEDGATRLLDAALLDNGRPMGYGEGPLHRHFTQTPFLPKKKDSDEYCEDVLNLQVHGLLRRWQHTHTESLVIGISGGLDSTLALIVSVLAADRLGYNRSQVIGVTMPGFGTSDRTYSNALAMMEELGVSIHEIPIRNMATQHLNDINHDLNNHDITYENAQARIRTLVLMDLANKYNGLVVGTGDMSELALGWATYCGDQMSMYGVNAGVPKTLVRYLVRYAAENIFGERLREILMDVIDTPVSPELLPTDDKGNIAQITEDKVGPYELHDFFLYYFLRYGFTREKIAFMASMAFDGVYSEEVIEHWLSVFMRRFFTQQFKRSCLPDGPKVVGVSLSPRGDWRMPSDVAVN